MCQAEATLNKCTAQMKCFKTDLDVLEIRVISYWSRSHPVIKFVTFFNATNLQFSCVIA